jgi:hypothetical protein
MKFCMKKLIANSAKPQMVSAPSVRDCRIFESREPSQGRKSVRRITSFVDNGSFFEFTKAF